MRKCITPSWTGGLWQIEKRGRMRAETPHACVPPSLAWRSPPAVQCAGRPPNPRQGGLWQGHPGPVAARPPLRPRLTPCARNRALVCACARLWTGELPGGTGAGQGPGRPCCPNGPCHPIKGGIRQGAALARLAGKIHWVKAARHAACDRAASWVGSTPRVG